MPTVRISVARMLMVPRLTKKLGRACTTMRAPSRSGGCTSSSSPTGQVTVSETSAAGSRRVRNAVLVPGRAVI